MSTELTNIDCTTSQRKEIALLLKRYLPNTLVWAYGSRVSFTAKPSSDLDIVAFASKEQGRAVDNLKEAFEESLLPFRVDLFVWDELPESFQRNIEKEYVVMQRVAAKGNIPAGWKFISFNNAVEVNPQVKIEKDHEYPFVDMKSIDPARREVSFSELRIFKSGGAKFLPKDTLMARITPCLENGKIVRYMPLRKNGAAFGSTEFIVIRGKDGVTDNDFAYYLTMWSEFREFAISQMTGSSGRQRVPVDSLAGFNFNLPPLPEQRAIAQILGSLDDKIELNQRMNETLEAMAQALFKSWFVDFDPVIDNALAAGNDIPEELKERADIRASLDGARKSLPKDIRKLFPDQFEHTEEMGWIPRGWRVDNLDSMAEILNGFAFKSKDYTSNGVFVLRTKNFSDAGYVEYLGDDVYLPHSFLDSHKNYQCEEFDFFLVMVGASTGKVSTLFSNCLPALRNQNMWCFRSKGGFVSRFYINHTVQRIIELNSQIASGSARNFFRKEDFKRFAVIKPIDDALKAFDRVTLNIYQRVSLNHQKNSSLANLRDTLLPKLLSGEVRISQAEKFLEKLG